MTLKAGQKAPPFNAKDQDGKPVSLTDFKGKKLILWCICLKLAKFAKIVSFISRL